MSASNSTNASGTQFIECVSQPEYDMLTYYYPNAKCLFSRMSFGRLDVQNKKEEVVSN